MRTGGTLSPDALLEKFVLGKKRGKESQADREHSVLLSGSQQGKGA